MILKTKAATTTALQFRAIAASGTICSSGLVLENEIDASILQTWQSSFKSCDNCRRKIRGNSNLRKCLSERARLFSQIQSVEALSITMMTGKLRLEE
ncbi:MAG: hypothetical protein AAF497_22875 [Planctomycetota bacterium]